MDSVNLQSKLDEKLRMSLGGKQDTVKFEIFEMEEHQVILEDSLFQLFGSKKTEFSYFNL